MTTILTILLLIWFASSVILGILAALIDEKSYSWMFASVAVLCLLGVVAL